MGTVLPWFALAAVTAVLSAAAWCVRGLVGRNDLGPADSMAWRGTSPGCGWRPDPSRRHAYRFHDGRGWTTLVVTDGRAKEP
jgi:hypothetical protein